MGYKPSTSAILGFIVLLNCARSATAQAPPPQPQRVATLDVSQSLPEGSGKLALSTVAFSSEDSIAVEIYQGTVQGLLVAITANLRRTFRRIQTRLSSIHSYDQAERPDILPTPREIASVKVMRMPCSGRRMTIGRGSMVWPGTSWKSYFLRRTLRIMSICSMA